MVQIKWEVGHAVKMFEGAYGTGTIARLYHGDGPEHAATHADVCRPYLYASEAGAWHVGVETVRMIILAQLVPAEVGRDGQPRRFYHGVYTWEDIQQARRGEF